MGNLRTKWAGNGKIINQWQHILVVMFDYQRVAFYHLFASAKKKLDYDDCVNYIIPMGKLG